MKLNISNALLVQLLFTSRRLYLVHRCSVPRWTQAWHILRTIFLTEGFVSKAMLPRGTKGTYQCLYIQRFSTHKCKGFQLREVTHCLWPSRVLPSCLPVEGSQMHTYFRRNNIPRETGSPQGTPMRTNRNTYCICLPCTWSNPE